MEYLRAGPSTALESVLWLGISAVAFHGAGAFILGGYLRGDRGAGALRAVFAQALGLFAFSLWVFGWGSLGFLNPPAVLSFLAAGVLWSALKERGSTAAFVAALRRATDASPGMKFLGLLVAVPAVLSLAAAQAPAVGNDALSYHFYLPKLFVEHGRVFYDPNHARSLWPFLMEMVFSAGLLIQGTALAQSYGWLASVLAVVSVPAAARFFLGGRSWVSAAVFAGSLPAVWMQSFCGNVDNAMMLYAFLAFAALWIWRERGFKAKEGMVAGLCAGALISVKLYALASVVALGGVFIPVLIGSRGARGLVRGLAIFTAAAGLTGGFWYLRSWVHTGNPFFPFFAKWFGGAGFSHGAVGFAELPKTALNLLFVPFNVALRPDPYGGEPVGCLFLAVLPLVWFLRRAATVVRAMLAFAAVYTVIWYYSIQHIRFLFPALPFLAFVFGALWADWAGVNARAPHKILAAALLAFHVALSGYYPARFVPAALGFEPAERFVASQERTYPFLKKAAPHFKPGDKILFTTETRLFYSPVEAIDLTPAIGLAARREGVSMGAWLRNNGITHVLTSAHAGTPDEKYPERYLGAEITREVRFSEILSERANWASDIFDYTLWKILPAA